MKKAVNLLLVLSMLMTNFAFGSGIQEAFAVTDDDFALFSTADIFGGEKEFEQALSFWELDGQVAVLDGRLDKPEMLLGMLGLLEKGNDVFEKLYAYAYLSYAANQRSDKAQERYKCVKAAAARFENAIAPLRRQMLALPQSYLRSCRREKRFECYQPMLDALISADGRSEPSEDLLRELTPALAFPAELASIVLNADLNPENVTRPDGSVVPATASELSRALSSDDAQYRREAYERYYAALGAHRNTLAASLEAHISGRIRQAELRRHDVSHESQVMVGRYEMPPQAADVLLAAVNHSLPIYQKGNEIKARTMGLDTIRPYDIAVPEKARAGTYTFEQASSLVLQALLPLGRDYQSYARRILTGGHVNYQPGDGKQAGAFCITAGSDVDPYIHMNFDGSLNSVSTLAHELGHAVHMVLSRQTQNPAASHPALASTETAAILNEVLVMRYLLRDAGDADELRCAANSYADLIGSTLYQQTRYFAFERSAYQMIASGGVLTADKGDALWEAISAPYRGGSLQIPEVASGAWAGIPHLYRDFYVANYAFSIAAAETFANQLEDGEITPVLAFLTAGGSRRADELFYALGVDFSSQNAYNDVVTRLDGLYDILKGLEMPARAA